MSTIEYVVLFPEDGGYIYLGPVSRADWGDSDRSSTCRVLSLRDGSQYQRKWISAHLPAGADYHEPEVHFYRSHPLIPEQRYVRTYNALPADDPAAQTYLASSLISKHSNLGTLRTVLTFVSQGEFVVEEDLLWRLFEQRLRALQFLHANSIALRDDSEAQNVFAGFRDFNTVEVDFYTSALDTSCPLDPEIWEDVPRSKQRAARDGPRIKDLKALRKLGRFSKDIKALAGDIEGAWSDLCFLAGEKDPDTSDVREALQKARDDNQWSAEFFECLDTLYQISEGIRRNPVRYNELQALRQRVVSSYQAYKDSQKQDPDHSGLVGSQGGIDWATFWNRQGTVFRASSRAALLAPCEHLPGPWRIARYDTTTGQIVGVEKLVYNDSLAEPNVVDKEALRQEHGHIGWDTLVGVARDATDSQYITTVDTNNNLTRKDRSSDEDFEDDAMFGLDPSSRTFPGFTVPPAPTYAAPKKRAATKKSKRASTKSAESAASVSRPMRIEKKREFRRAVINERKAARTAATVQKYGPPNVTTRRRGASGPAK